MYVHVCVLHCPLCLALPCCQANLISICVYVQMGILHYIWGEMAPVTVCLSSARPASPTRTSNSLLPPAPPLQLASDPPEARGATWALLVRKTLSLAGCMTYMLIRDAEGRKKHKAKQHNTPQGSHVSKEK